CLAHNVGSTVQGDTPCSITSVSASATTRQARRSSWQRWNRSASAPSWKATSASGWAERVIPRCGCTGPRRPPARCTLPSPPGTTRRSTRSTAPRSLPAARTTARRDCARTIIRTTTPPSSSARTATTSRRCATARRPDPMSIEAWLAFVAASAVLLVIPGPTILTVIGYSIAHGRRAQAPLVAAVALGDSTALALSLLGLGALLATSAFWFSVVKWVGGLYLIYLGV